jgi:hypothetical protein
VQLGHALLDDCLQRLAADPLDDGADDA